MNSLSYVLGPIKSADPSLVNIKHTLSKSAKLLSDAGFVRFIDGKPVLLTPLARSLRKLKNMIRHEMEKVSANEIVLPLMIKESILESTGNNQKEELFRLTDRMNKNVVLSATHEDAITYLMSCDKMLSEKNFPSRFYQIGTKFRDELHPKHGLIRSKEFIMKDLYCFDDSPESRHKTYNEVLNQYHNFFNTLQVPYVCVKNKAPDTIDSHEFHFLTDIGEDTLMICKSCGHKVSISFIEDSDKCQNCSSPDVVHEKGIEVAHTFNIGIKYSKGLNAIYTNKNKESKFLELSSYGIGLTRLLAASTEVLSTDNEIRWPFRICPYSVCIIPPKEGSKEETAGIAALKTIYSDLNTCLRGDVVVDDRGRFTIGKRLLLDKKFGFPFIIVIGGNILESSPQVELWDVYSNKQIFLHPSDVVNAIMEKISST